MYKINSLKKGILFLTFLAFNFLGNASPDHRNKSDHTTDDLAERLSAPDVVDILLYAGDDNKLLNSLWQNGKNREALLAFVKSSRYNDYMRLAASEVLFAKQKNYPGKNLGDIIGYIYSRAFRFCDLDDTGCFHYSGNEWGFMAFNDSLGCRNDRILGNHLLMAGSKAVPYLTELLDRNGIIFYRGSKEATLGQILQYRVKDAAAYYIGRIMGMPVVYHENFADRDVEIEHLRQKLKVKEVKE